MKANSDGNANANVGSSNCEVEQDGNSNCNVSSSGDEPVDPGGN